MRYFFFFTFLFTLNFSFSQTVKALEKAADEAFAEKDYYSAMVHLSDALEIDPENTNLYFKYADVCRQFNAYELAEKYYTKVKESEIGNQYPLTNFWLGMMKKSLGKYEEANELFNEFLRANSTRHPLGRRAAKEIEDCEYAMEYESDETKEVEIEHLSKKINTEYSEFGGIAVGDTLYYSSHKYEAEVDGKAAPQKISKNLYSLNGEKGKTMKYGFNDQEKLTAHTAFSADGNRIYFTICNFVNAGKINCELYYREKDKRNRWEKAPVKLPESINAKGFSTTQPTVGYDSLAKKEILFFVSDKVGSEGGLDIWFTEVRAQGFGPVMNLIAVNTPEDDLTPYFNNATQTLYFSSDGRQSFGGYDVFKTKRTRKWGEIENLGQPINTSYNDLYFSINGEETEAYLSSNRPGSFYIDESNKSCCYDIYKADIVQLEKEEPGEETPPVAINLENEELVNKGIETANSNRNPNPNRPPTATNRNTPENNANLNPNRNLNSNRPYIPQTLTEFLPLALYFDNDEPDARTTRTYTKKSYPKTFWKYYDKKPIYIREFTKPLDNEQAMDAKADIECFFQDKVRFGYDRLLLFSELLLQRLEQGESIEIFIKGYTSPLAKNDYNLNLGKRRVSSLKNHFTNYYDGILEFYIEAGKLTLTEVSFGETTAANDISDDYYDLRNSIYNVEAAQERRVEIVEVKSMKEESNE